MNFLIDKNTISKSLSHVQGVVNRKNTIPILLNVKISAKNGEVVLTATDMGISISEVFKADIKEEGENTVPVHTFYDIIRKLPDNSKIELIFSDNKLKIKANNSKFSLPVITATDFPIINIEDNNHQFNIKKSDLHKLFNKAKFAISSDETRYYLQGIFLQDGLRNGQEVLRAVATDGHKLARIEVPLPAGAKNMPHIIIPQKAILEMNKIFTENDEDTDILVTISDTKIKVELQNIIFISKLIDGNFPDCEKVVPIHNVNRMRTNLKELFLAIDRVSTLSSNKDRGIKLILGHNKLNLEANNLEAGFAKEELNVEYVANNNLEIGFNSKYLLELNSILSGTNVDLYFSNKVAPIIIKESDDDKTLFVIMPIKA